MIYEFETVNVDTIHKRYQGWVDIQGDKKELLLDLTIDREPAESIVGDKISEPTAKVSGRVNHKTLEFDLLLNYEHHSERIKGHFVDDLMEQMEGVVFAESLGFTEEEGNRIILTHVG